MPIEGLIEPKSCRVTFGDGKVHDAITFVTYMIESEKYLPFVMDQLKSSGRFGVVRRQLNSLEDVLALKENHIFNCLGFGAAKVFGDKKLKGIKGHVMKIPLPKQLRDHILFMKVNGRWILQCPQRQTNYLAIGISYEDNKTDPFI